MAEVIGWFPQMNRTAKLSSKTKTIEEVVLVQIDDPNTPLTTITSFRRCPVRFQPHPLYPQYYCIDWHLDQPTEIPNVLPLRIIYSTEIPDGLLKDGKPVYEDDPLRRPLWVAAGYYNYPKVMRMTFNTSDTFDPAQGPPEPTVPVVTTAGERLFLQIEDEVRMFKCRKNVAVLPKFMAKGGKFTNAEPISFQGASFWRYELLICGIELSEAKFEFGKVYYIMSFNLMVAPDKDGWCEKLRNAGFHEKGYEKVTNRAGRVTYNTYLKAISVGKPENPQYPSSPVLLDPDGIAYRSPGPGQDQNTLNRDRTGPILSTESTIAQGTGITPAMFKKAELKFWPRMVIPFKKYVPLS